MQVLSNQALGSTTPHLKERLKREAEICSVEFKIFTGERLKKKDNRHYQNMTRPPIRSSRRGKNHTEGMERKK